MKTIVFATNNRHKLDEVRKITESLVHIVSLADIGCSDEIPETAETLEGNALQKACFIRDKFGYDCFADDTGLEVEALDNAPGVYSARYAGPIHDADANMDKLLHELEDKENRRARFRTIIALLYEGGEYLFEGTVNGHIIKEKKGAAGFGYDPVFVPEGHTETFAELGDDTKNHISHRALAVRKLVAFLSGIPK